LEPKWEWPVVEAFAKGVADRMAREAPDRFTSNMRKAVRGGRIFVDWLRNQRTSTAICPWSTRAKPQAPIALSISWDELRRAKRADPVTVKTVARRLKLADPWPGYFSLRQSFTREAAAKLDAD
jgi:bifunctional non-homologous end joining protein LigD